MDSLFDELVAAARASAPLPAAANWDDPESSSEAETDASELLRGLNPQQHEAVVHSGSPLLVVAGAGSGKTKVLTHRIAYALATGRARADQIIAITFTNKAAAEMRERVRALVGPQAGRMWVSTFHSACVRILRREYRDVPIRSTFSVYDMQDAQRLMVLTCKRMNLDPKQFNPKMFSRRVSDFKNELITPSRALAQARTDIEKTIAEAYRLYNEALQQAHAMDFDDLIMRTVQLLQNNPQVARTYRRRFRHVLVDEYQDTNHAQYMLVRALVGNEDDEAGVAPAELTVVGDSDQSIYAFRGATIRNIEEFEKDYPDAHTVVLEQNYRSTQNILSAANAVIAANSGRRAKRLWTDSGDGAKVVGYAADSEHDEARFIAREIDALTDSGVNPGDVAIFYRTNAQSRALEEIFIRTGLPYRVVGGTRFYERKEVKDALAYLRAIANPDDSVSIRRIFNTPRRGLGDKAEATLAAYAHDRGISFGSAIAAAVEGEIPGLAARTLNALRDFDATLTEVRDFAEDATPAEILDAILDRSGYVATLRASDDPQDETRVENLAELHAVAAEFLETQPEGDLGDFLERVALVADSDSIPGDEAGQITLMTVHTAKGLEFPVVFASGMEDGTFPHARSIDDATQLAEERRLAYVALTRARERLYVTRAAVRSAWGMPQDLPPSRFLNAIPDDVLDWRREVAGNEALRASSTSRSPLSFGSGYTPKASAVRTVQRAGVQRSAEKDEAAIPALAAGDRVLHDSYGLGTVLEVTGQGRRAVANVDFGDGAVKKLMLRYAPLTKLEV
ncbi:DNA helicase PcrA [Bowdeniella massiliensis]|uniref:DNA helicase PcrA n=1 Tax=Bowdeniella massiliensis TaxID=2932264 RepID=UPI00202970D4|nr:DNA helicase PcrA [Bowdeniella massiliensis]